MQTFATLALHCIPGREPSSCYLDHGNVALLAESLEVIQKTSALILSALEPEQVAAEQTEAATEQPNINATDAALAEVA